MPGNTWIVFALLSGFLMAVVNLLDKLVLDRWSRHPAVPVLLLGIISTVPAGLILLLNGVPRLPPRLWILVLAAGAALLGFAAFYFRAAAVEEISRVVPLQYLGPLFVSGLAALFLEEVFPPRRYLGVALMIVGAVLVSSRFPLRLRPGRAFWLMILSAISLSIQLVITKHLLSFADYWSVFALIRLAMAVAMLPLLIQHFRDLIASLREHGTKVIWVMVGDQHIALAGALFLTIAAASGPITLVNALAAVQPFFVLVFSLLLSRARPLLFREETGRAVVLMKLAAVTLMFLGVLLIT